MVNLSKLTPPQIMGITLFLFLIFMGGFAIKDSMINRRSNKRRR